MPYRIAPPDEPARQAAFGELTPETRARLAASCEGRGAAPLLAERSPLGGLGRWWRALTLGAALGTAGCLLAGFGAIDDGPRRQGDHARAAAALGGAAVVFCLAMARRFARLPVRPGVYLFARELIDARGARVRLLSTASLRGVRRAGRRVELHFAGGERYSFTDARSPSQIERSIDSHLGALRHADASCDAAAQAQLDPLCAERARWADAPPAAAPAPRTLAPPATALAAALLAGAPLGLLASLASDRASDAVGIERARRAHDEGSLWLFLEKGGAASPLGQKASKALFDMVVEPETLASMARFAAEADPHHYNSAEKPYLFDRWLLEFVRVAVGPERDQVDRVLFSAALDSGKSHPLARYADVGSRADEVRRLHLPRRQLAEAIQQRKATELYRLREAPIDDATRAEAGQALQKLASEAREHLASATALRTPLARQIHAELGHAAERQVALVLVAPRDRGPEAWCPEGSADASAGLLTAARSALEPLIDQDVMWIAIKRDSLPPRFPDPAARIELRHCTTPALKVHLGMPEPISTTTLSLTFVAADGTRASPVGLQFQSAHPSLTPPHEPGVDPSPPPFSEVARQAIIEAVVGERRAR